MLKNILSERLQTAINQFILWLENFGETSYDHQTFFASPFGNKIKSLYYKNAVLGSLAVSPLIFSAPSNRPALKLCVGYAPASLMIFVSTLVP